MKKGHDKMSGFICPVCRCNLCRGDISYKCGNGHSFDISASGYVNLLLSKDMNAKLPGDNKMMVNSRAEFLSKGYYSHLAEEMERTVTEYYSGGLILDAGCGEGYYTEKFYGSAAKCHEDHTLCAVDISKFACAKTARRFKGDRSCETAVASVFHLPTPDNSADIIVTMFAPFCRDEFFRTMKEGGILIMAIPGEEHLFGLKKKIYDNPYKNETADYKINGFEFIESRKVSKTIFIDNPADIKCLFSMTPYYYKTGVEGHERVNSLKSLETQAEFEVIVYRKNHML